MIHPTAIITGKVELGERVVVEPYVIIRGPVRIEDDAYIGAHAMIGGPPNYRGKYPSPTSASHEPAGVVIGSGACVREHSQVHHGVEWQTVVGSDVLLMPMTHVGHDCLVDNEATLGVGTILGGFVMIAERANLGLSVAVHPWILIGEASMVGVNSSVIRDVEPYAKVAGSPARLLGSNRHQDPRLPDWYDRESIRQPVWYRWEHWCDLRNDRRRKRGKPEL